jgi:hypothetical protein
MLAEQGQKPAGMVVVAMGKGDAIQAGEVPVNAAGIVKQGPPLPRVEEEAPPLPLHQGGKAMLPQGGEDRSHRVLTEYGDAEGHESS